MGRRYRHLTKIRFCVCPYIPKGLFVNFNPFHKSFTPNATYNQLKNRTNSVIIKSAGNKTNESYEDAIIDR